MINGGYIEVFEDLIGTSFDERQVTGSQIVINSQSIIHTQPLFINDKGLVESYGHWFEGGYGNDVLKANVNSDPLFVAKDGTYVFAGHNGDDQIVGGLYNDNLYGDNGDDYISGGDGDDYIYGNAIKYHYYND